MGLTREHGPVLVRRLHGRDTLFVGDLDLVTDLADEERFAKAIGPALENVREFAADGLFTAYNDEPNLCYRIHSQCIGLQPGGEANLMVATRSVADSRPAEPGSAHTGRFCASMYCLTTVRGAPPTVPAK